MKRSLAQIGITCFSVLAIAFYLPETAVLILGGFGLAVGIIALCVTKLRKRAFISLIALTVFLSCSVSLGYTRLFVEPVVEKYADGEHTVRAVLRDEPYKSYGMWYYRLKTVQIDGEDARLDLLLRDAQLADIEPDDELVFSASLVAETNDYYRAKGYLLTTDSYHVSFEINEAQSHSLYYYAIQARRTMRTALNRVLPSEESALCRAVLIGDKYAMERETRDDFRYAGASYFIVVSGMHFSVLCLLVMYLTRRIRLGKHIYLSKALRLILMLLFIAAYMAITGFQPSVMRAGVMMTVYIIAKTIRRQVYSLNHLGLSGILLPLVMSPYAAGDSGLILSFYATMSILLWAEPIARRICIKDEDGVILRFRPRAALKRLLSDCREKLTDPEKRKECQLHKPDIRLIAKKSVNCVLLILSVSLAANMMVFPLSILLFREFSTITILSSLLLYPLIYLILILSLCICVFSFLPWLSAILAWPLYWFSAAVLWIIGVLAGLPFAIVRIRSAYVFIWLGVTVVMLTTAYVLRRKRQLLSFAIIGSIILFLVGFMIDSAVRLNNMRLEVFHCGEGVSVALDSGGRLHLLSMDCGSKDYYRIMRDLSDRYAAADTVLCKDHKTYERYATYSDEIFAISDVLLYDSGEEVEADATVSFSDDSSFILDDGVVLDVAVCDKRPTALLRVGDRSILLLDRKTKLSDIPLHWRTPDITVLSGSAEYFDQLQSDVYIISGTSEESALSVQGNVCYTNETDITYDLR